MTVNEAVTLAARRADERLSFLKAAMQTTQAPSTTQPPSTLPQGQATRGAAAPQS